MTAKVYLIQHPLRAGTPLDITDASRYGVIQKPILPSTYNAQADVSDAVRHLEAGLSDIDNESYILCIGDPALIAVASIIAARNTGGELKLLKWNRSLDRSGKRQRTVGHYAPCDIEIDV